MGIVNVMTDSFSEPGRSIEDAIALGLQLVDEGADIIDVGGESTRPVPTGTPVEGVGSGVVPKAVGLVARVTAEDELERVLPVVRALSETGVIVSVDTMRASVAYEAVRMGAQLINDVSGGLVDPGMLEVVAGERSVAYILQHWREPLDHESTHVDVVPEVIAELSQRLEVAVDKGIRRENIILDPGVGFGKTSSQCWELVRRAEEVMALSPGRLDDVDSGSRGYPYPFLWGVSRKRFLADAYSYPTEAWQRDVAGSALTALLARAGAWGVRVHTATDNRVAIDAATLAKRGMGGSAVGGGTLTDTCRQSARSRRIHLAGGDLGSCDLAQDDGEGGR
jgi:dihydropteroate synthase